MTPWIYKQAILSWGKAIPKDKGLNWLRDGIAAGYHKLRRTPNGARIARLYHDNAEGQILQALLLPAPIAPLDTILTAGWGIASAKNPRAKIQAIKDITKSELGKANDIAETIAHKGETFMHNPPLYLDPLSQDTLTALKLGKTAAIKKQAVTLQTIAAATEKRLKDMVGRSKPIAEGIYQGLPELKTDKALSLAGKTQKQLTDISRQLWQQKQRLPESLRIHADDIDSLLRAKTKIKIPGYRQSPEDLQGVRRWLDSVLKANNAEGRLGKVANNTNNASIRSINDQQESN